MKKLSFTKSGQKIRTFDEIMKEMDNLPQTTITREQIFGPPTVENRVERLEYLYETELAASKKESEELVQRILALEKEVCELKMRLQNANIAEVRGNSPRPK